MTAPKGEIRLRGGTRTNAKLAAAVALAVLPCAAAQANPLHDAIGAPEAFKLSGSIRSRTEAVDGQFRPNAARNDQLWSLRTAIFAEYDTGPMRIGGELLDARAYGQAPNSSVGTAEVDAFELVQAYVAADLGDKSSFQAGRFTYHLGSGRLVAKPKFRNTTNGFTGVNLDWREADGQRLQLIWAMPQQRNPEDRHGLGKNKVMWDLETTDLQLFGAHLTLSSLIPDGEVELYALGLRERDDQARPTRNRRLVTPGVRFSRKPGKGAFDFDVEAIYQFGKARATNKPGDITDLDVAARFLHAEAGKRFDSGWQPRLAFVFDYGSGEDEGRKFGRFDTYYGSRRGDFGPTHLFGPLNRSNIVAPGARIEASPTKRFDGMFHYRELWLDSATDSFANTTLRDRTGRAGKHAGRQFEFRARYSIVPDVIRFEVGAAYLDKGRFFTADPNPDGRENTRYAYADVVIDF